MPGGKNDKDFFKQFQIRYIFDKHIKFLEGTMVTKSVRCLPGIEETLGEKLADQGIHMAYQLFAHFLLLKMNRASFIAWMEDTFSATKDNATVCCFALEAWVANRL